jgi:hypothetical protein
LGQLITKRNWKTIVFVNDEGKMTSRVCSKCGRLWASVSYLNDKKGMVGKRADCKACYRKVNEKTLNLRKHRHRAKVNDLASTMTLEQRQKALGEQNGKCILTHMKDNLSVDHFTPLSWKTGLGDSYENIIYLDRNINISKGNRNPFSWIRTQDREIKKRFYNDLVPMLANRNDMTVKEFEEYVNDSFAEFENKRGALSK